MKIRNTFPLIITLVLSLCSCSKLNNENFSPIVGEEIDVFHGVKFDEENLFFDGFNNGIDASLWYIAKQAWGGGNGGVVPENIHYTDDGSLFITGNGKFYKGDIKGIGDVKDGRFTGGALISKFVTKPGRYEIKMKALPRQGACSAFWTFAYNNDDGSNHEIDIELPGGHRNDIISFGNVLNTNYVTEQYYQSQDVNVSNINDGNKTYLNDGKWHVLGFDWYTNPEMIVYYVDGKISAVSTSFVPSLTTRLWLGTWFPVTSAFVGSADFESDNMFVDYVKYVPFLDQPCTYFEPAVNGVASIKEYPNKPFSKPIVNKVATADFENVTYSNDAIGGWSLTKIISETKEVSEVANIDKTNGMNGSSCLMIKDGGVARQFVDSIYENFTHSLSFYAKGKGKFTLRYTGVTTSDILENKTINIDSNEYKLYSLELVAPTSSQTIRISIDTTSGNTVYVDNISLIQK